MFKKIIPIFIALAAIPSAVSFTVHADGGHHGGGGKTRFVPYAPFNDILNNINQEYPLSDFWHGIQVLNSSATDTIADNTTEVLQTWDKFKSYLASHMYSNVAGQRVKDLVDYANQSTDGLTAGKAVTSFIAKRSYTLSYDENNNPDLVETDTMYFWKDENHTIANDFSGIQIGDFYMMPNTAFFIREFSDNRAPIMFYADVSGVQIVYSDAVSGFDNQPFQLRFKADTTYTCVDSEGNVDSLTTGNRTLTDIRALKGSDINSLKNSIDAGDSLASQAEYNKHFSEYTENGILPNIFVFTNNVQKSDGTRLFPNNWRGGGGVSTWYLSSGGFFPRNDHTTDFTFNTQTDTNFDPRKPPAIKNPDPRLNVNTLLTTANVDNYADFGVTYNSLTGKFELDVNALAAGLAAQIAPQFEGVFNGVYQAQPDIDTNDWSAPSLTNNYVSDYSDLVVDISNEVQEVLDSRSPVWVPPRYSALNTEPIVSYTYPTLPTNTVPQSVLDDVGTVSRIGFDAFGTLGDSIIGILVALAVLGAVSYYIWG